MKKLLCAILAGTLCITAAAGLTGCGCDRSSSQEPGYKVTATEPDLKNENFGFFIINKDEVMLTEYLGSDKNVKIPDTYDNYKVTVIGASVFNNNSDIESVEISDNVIEIKDYAFASCQNLKSVKLSKNLQTLGTNVFFHCSKLTGIELPSTIKDFGIYTFSASGLESITIPSSDTFTKIDRFAFFQSYNLKEANIPATVTSIADDAFSECADDFTIKAPEGSYAENYANTHDFKFEATK